MRKTETRAGARVCVGPRVDTYTTQGPEPKANECQLMKLSGHTCKVTRSRNDECERGSAQNTYKFEDRWAALMSDGPGHLSKPM